MQDHDPLLRKLDALASLSDEDRRLLAQVAANPVAVPARTDLIRDGDPPQGVFLVLEGIACRYKLLPDGARQILALLVPGDFCDLDVALVDAIDHSIGTLSPCRFTHVPTRTVRELLDHPRIARALRLAAMVEAATMRQWLVNMGRRPCEKRLAHLLCEMLVRLRVVGLASADGFHLPLTQTDLADATGMTSVHVNRSLQALRRAALIGVDGRRIVIPNVAALEAVAAFDPGYLYRARTDGPRLSAGGPTPGRPTGDAFRGAGIPTLP